jgi:hypothetical protein
MDITEADETFDRGELLQDTWDEQQPHSEFTYCESTEFTYLVETLGSDPYQAFDSLRKKLAAVINCDLEQVKYSKTIEGEISRHFFEFVTVEPGVFAEILLRFNKTTSWYRTSVDLTQVPKLYLKINNLG